MPIIFKCTLKCEAPGCESNQAAEAHYEGPVLSLGILPVGGPTAPFSLRYDKKSKLDWVVIGFGRMACSPACKDKVEAAEKKRDAERLEHANLSQKLSPNSK